MPLWEFRGGQERSTWTSEVEKSPTRAGREEDWGGGIREGGEGSFQGMWTRGTHACGPTKQHMQESLGSKQDRELGWRERGSLITHSTGLDSHRPKFKSWLCSF